MATDDRSRLDDAVVRSAAAAIEAPAKRAVSFAEALGPVFGPLVLEREQTRRAEARAQFDRLSAALGVARLALEQRRAAGTRELAPLFEAMEAARVAWEEATTAYDRQRIANQSALIPLENRVVELVSELNAPAPGYGHNVRQWEPRDDLPKAPPRVEF
jgi:hypothetical protein